MSGIFLAFKPIYALLSPCFAPFLLFFSMNLFCTQTGLLGILKNAVFSPFLPLLMQFSPVWSVLPLPLCPLPFALPTLAS